MKIYKFIDRIDGNYAFILAKDEQKAAEALSKQTSIPFVLVESKSPEELKRPIVLLNQMLPF